MATLGANIPAIVVFTVVGVAWSVVGLLVIAPRVFPEHWFENALADFGQSQGNVATGFVLCDMADPRRQSGAAAYGYKQLTYEPILSGGIITALSVPFITDVGLVPFTVVSAVIAVAMVVWGVMRNRSRGA